MAFFKSFQNNLPSVNISSILDSVSSRVDDLANAVSDVTYAVSDQLTEQVTTIINKVQDEEEGEAGGVKESDQAAVAQEGRASSKSMWPISLDSGETASVGGSDVTEAAEYIPSQLEWEWRDGCWRVKKSEAELAEEERRKKEEMELWEEKEQRRKERRQRQQEKRAALEKTREEQEEREQEVDDGGERDAHQQGADNGKEHPPLTTDDPEVSLPEGKSPGQEDGAKRSPEQVGDDEKEPELPEKVKKKKSDKKKMKGEKAPKKCGDNVDAEKKKAKEKKSKKKKKKGQMVCCFCFIPSSATLLPLKHLWITILKINLSAQQCASITFAQACFSSPQRTMFAADKRDV